MRIFYYGCRRQAGHYFFAPTGYGHIRLDNEPDFDLVRHPDQRELPYCPSRSEERKEGIAKLTYIDDADGNVAWTVLGWRDYSVDKRPGSHSNLIVKGQHTFDQVLALGKEHFPDVMERQRCVINIGLTTDFFPAWEAS